MKILIAKQGDSLERIAEKYQIEMDVLKEFNPEIRASEQLSPGTKIKIPSAPRPVSGLGSDAYGELSENFYGDRLDEPFDNTSAAWEQSFAESDSEQMGEALGGEFTESFQPVQESFGGTADEFDSLPMQTAQTWPSPSPQTFPIWSSFPASFAGGIQPDWARLSFSPSNSPAGSAGIPYPYYGYAGYPPVEPAQWPIPSFPPAGAFPPPFPTQAEPDADIAEQPNRSEGEQDPLMDKRARKRSDAKKSARKKQGEARERGNHPKASGKSAAEKANLPWINI